MSEILNFLFIELYYINMALEFPVFPFTFFGRVDVVTKREQKTVLSVVTLTLSLPSKRFTPQVSFTTSSGSEIRGEITMNGEALGVTELLNGDRLTQRRKRASPTPLG